MWLACGFCKSEFEWPLVGRLILNADGKPTGETFPVLAQILRTHYFGHSPEWDDFGFPQCVKRFDWMNCSITLARRGEDLSTAEIWMGHVRLSPELVVESGRDGL